MKHFKISPALILPLVLMGFWISEPLAFAAEMVLNYDVSAPGAWEDGGLKDSMGAGPIQAALPTLTEEEFKKYSALEGFDPTILGVNDFGSPEFVAKQGPGGRSYLSFEKLGALSAGSQGITEQKPECTSGAFLNSAGLADGYTMEMLVRIQPEYRHTSKLAIGGGGETSLENNFVGLGGKKSSTLTTIVVPGEEISQENRDKFQNVTELPFEDFVVGEWVHLVKVHDHAARVMTFYIDGQPVKETDLSDLPENGEYPARQEYFTLIGAETRRISGLDFSFFRAYRGAMNAEEVDKLYQASQKAP
jgi:hypothetical protein